MAECRREDGKQVVTFRFATAGMLSHTPMATTSWCTPQAPGSSRSTRHRLPCAQAVDHAGTVQTIKTPGGYHLIHAIPLR